MRKNFIIMFLTICLSFINLTEIHADSNTFDDKQIYSAVISGDGTFMKIRTYWISIKYLNSKNISFQITMKKAMQNRHHIPVPV